MPIERINKVKMFLISISGLLGAVIGIYEFHIMMMENISEFVHEESAPIAKEEAQKAIKLTVDSIFQNIDERIRVGLIYDPETERVTYMHTNGKEYRTFFDTTELHYYFINDNNLEEWCK